MILGGSGFNKRQKKVELNWADVALNPQCSFSPHKHIQVWKSLISSGHEIINYVLQNWEFCNITTLSKKCIFVIKSQM